MNAALWCLEALQELGQQLWTSSLELCSVDIALDRRRQEVLVVPPRAPCEDGDHVPAGDVVPALAGARRRLTVRESFTEIASDVVPTWSPIPVSASLTVHRVPVLNICAPILVRLVDPAVSRYVRCGRLSA